MKIPIAIPLDRPNFVWLKPCAHCPSNVPDEQHDPESKDYASIPCRRKRMAHAFACGWRPNGYCAANYRLQYRGLNK